MEWKNLLYNSEEIGEKKRERCPIRYVDGVKDITSLTVMKMIMKTVKDWMYLAV